MNRTCWDQEMVVLLGWELVHIFFGSEGMIICLSHLQFPYHCVSIDMALSAKIDISVLAGLEQIVAFVLRVLHPELLTDELCFRMNLQGEVSTSHCVEEIETNRELSSESRKHRVAQQLSWIEKGEVHGRNLDACPPERKQQTVFLGYTVETPRIVRHP